MTTDKKTVSVAPLVLLSVVDHYERVVKASNTSSPSPNSRVIGVILGDNTESGPDTIRVTNSFAVPYEEDASNPDIWFLDHNYIDEMMEMFKKINAKEKLIGWYHTGPKLRQNDLKINQVFKGLTPNPLLLIVDVNSDKKIDIPTDCYVAVEEINEDGSSSEKTFIHYPSIIEAEEAEEIGVEHLLRDIRDENRGNLTINLSNNFKSLQSLNEKLSTIVRYLTKIITGQLPMNSSILVVDEETSDVNKAYTHEKQLSRAFNVRTNDDLMILYVSSLVRSIIAFHDLIDNKIENKKKDESSKNDKDTETTAKSTGEQEGENTEDKSK